MKCSICKKEIEVQLLSGWTEGHNAQPVNNGRCCNMCNIEKVIPARFEEMRRLEQ